MKGKAGANHMAPSGRQVLTVTDDSQVGRMLAFVLRQAEIDCSLVELAALGQAQRPWRVFDLVVIDVSGPGVDGIELTRQVRNQVANPILLFTSNRDESHILDAYQAGVDECIVKPVGPQLFLAKVRAWLRRSWAIPGRPLSRVELGAVQLDPARQAVSRKQGAPVRLTDLEFGVLYLLMSHPGQALPADVIVQRVWGLSGEGDGALLKNVVYRLRRKIEPDPGHPRYLQTVGRKGYLFSAR